VIDTRTLVFPNYDGNGMYISMGNAAENPHVGLWLPAGSGILAALIVLVTA